MGTQATENEPQRTLCEVGMSIGAVSAASAANSLLAAWRSSRAAEFGVESGIEAPGPRWTETSATRPAAGAGPTPEQSSDRLPPARDAAPVSTTAYQRNADGDEVSLASRQDELTPEERQQVAELKARDAEVRAHEQAHLAAAGGLARGGPRYAYQTGPDGKRYAVGGSVSIDTSPGRTPEETLAKAQKIRAAALAPAEPSSTDRAVAAKAAQMEAQARREIADQRASEQAESSGTADSPASPTPGSALRNTPVSALKLDVYG